MQLIRWRDFVSKLIVYYSYFLKSTVMITTPPITKQKTNRLIILNKTTCNRPLIIQISRELNEITDNNQT